MNSSTNLQNGVNYITPPKEDFEEVYIAVRTKENRVHDDEFVKTLPNISKHHPHYGEWQKRKWTLDNFTKYLKGKTYKHILEIGCGNGWFSSQISKYSEHVTGLDVGKVELEQAARCLGSESVQFICCSDWSLLPASTYDMIVFNASLQYFDVNEQFWSNIKRILTANGEVHILDTPIYSKEEIKAANQRSKVYFENLQQPTATKFYKHLSWENFPVKKEVLYTPNRFRMKLNKKLSPFPWIKLKSSEIL